MSKRAKRLRRRGEPRGQKRWHGASAITPPDKSFAPQTKGVTKEASATTIFPLELNPGDKLHPFFSEVIEKEGQEAADNLASRIMAEGFKIQEREKKLRKIHILDNLDDLYEADDKSYREALDKVRSLAPVAKRFVFDEEASRHLGHFIRDCPQNILDGHRFALPPFETTYVQVHIDETLKAIGKPTTAGYSVQNMDTRDLETGYLIHQNRVYPMVRGKPKDNMLSGGLSLFNYEMSRTPLRCTCRPIFFDTPLSETDDRDHVFRAMLLLGTTYNGLKMEDFLPFLHHVIVHANLDYDRFAKLPKAERDRKYWNLIFSASGDYRVMLAALMMLNEQKHVQTVYVPNNAMLIGGKRKVFKQHHRVVVHLKAHETIKRALGGTLLTPRAEHDVRGHHRNLRLRKECVHDWVDMSDPGDGGHVRWACTKCNGLRTTVTPHRRGDTLVGKVVKNYEVKE